MDIIVAGQAARLAVCRDLLRRAGYEIGGSLADDETCPVILGDAPHLFSRAMQLVEAGRHLLIASPMPLSAAQLTSLMTARRPRQAVFVWNERRYHPAYRLVSGLVRSDEVGWRPRLLRHTAFVPDRPAAAALRWRTSESLALLLELAPQEPLSVAACGVTNSWRGSIDFVSAAVDLGELEAFVQVGLGEGIERRETVLAAGDRRVYVDELDPEIPVRIHDDGGLPHGTSRRVSCASPSAMELSRLQCLAFLEATTSASRCQAEAALWLRVLGCWEALTASIETHGAAVEVNVPVGAGLRVLSGRGTSVTSAAPVSLKIVS